MPLRLMIQQPLLFTLRADAIRCRGATRHAVASVSRAPRCLLRRPLRLLRLLLARVYAPRCQRVADVECARYDDARVFDTRYCRQYLPLPLERVTLIIDDIAAS